MLLSLNLLRLGQVSVVPDKVFDKAVGADWWQYLPPKDAVSLVYRSIIFRSWVVEEAHSLVETGIHHVRRFLDGKVCYLR